MVGYDDIPLAAHRRMNLTTVRSDAVEMGRRAVELVVGAAREGGTSRTGRSRATG